MPEYSTKVNHQLTTLRTELTSQAEKITDLEDDMINLKVTNDKLTETVHDQHRCLETVDYDRRSHNFIVLGMPEDVPLTT